MRHVDDAHQPVGDGQAQRHQQQDAAQADAAEDRAQAVAPGQRGLDLAQAELQRRFHIRFGLDLEPRQQHGLGIGLLAAAQQPGGLEPLALVGAVHQRGGAHQAEFELDLRVGLAGVGFLDQRQLGLVGVALQLPYGGAACLLIRGKELERGQRRIELTAHAVVVHHVFGVVGHGGLGAADRIQALAVAHDQDLAGGHLDRVVGQRLQECGGSFVGCCQRLGQRLDAGIGFTNGDGPGFIGGQRLCVAAQQ